MIDEVIHDMDEDDIESKESLELGFGICHNIFIEIVSRTSLKTFDMLRCTSKQVAKLTYDDHLLDLYNERNDVITGFIIQYKKPWGANHQQFVTSHACKSADLSFLNSTQVVASSEQGLIVAEILEPLDYDSPILFICKPCSMDMKTLRYPNAAYYSVKFAIVNLRTIPSHYRIIRLSQMKLSQLNSRLGEQEYETLQFEIFDSMSWQWREFESIRLPHSVYPISDEAIVSSGSAFMLLSNGHILRIDAYSEKCFYIYPPSSTRDYVPYTLKLVKLYGKVGYVFKRNHDCWDTWIMNGDYRWVQLKVGNVDGYANVWWDFCNHNLYFFRGNDIKHVIPVNRSYEVFSFRSDFERISFTLL